ncbi:uncharacterized protein LOC124852083 isoform X4 [Hippoglossus stenolepis]|uniref:uncharacterized protein LOC124852083 isoform X4 n=1 Tax=Hippoglossus stenolepis TaxID=195615 RepID=UPI001FAF0261|nr:uncharacterized protein LOC124852083 isoform X4 [Hippoglossus stenolepis]
MFPEVLVKTNGFVTLDPRITARKEPGTFVLHITEAKQSDTAVYYCMKIHLQNLTFLKGTDLRVQGTGDMASVPTSAAHPEHSVYLQCSVLSDTVNKKCPEEKCMSCFKDGSRSFNYTRGDGVDEYEENPEKPSTVKCSFLNNISSSDAGTYFCALATCGARASGNGSKLNTEATGYLEGQQTDEDSLVYSTVTVKAEARDPKTAEEQSIYSEVRFLGLD